MVRALLAATCAGYRAEPGAVQAEFAAPACTNPPPDLRARPVTSWCCLIALDRASPMAMASAVEWIPLSWTVEPASSAARGARVRR
jgi:hypothetical protein